MKSLEKIVKDIDCLIDGFEKFTEQSGYQKDIKELKENLEELYKFCNIYTLKKDLNGFRSGERIIVIYDNYGLRQLKSLDYKNKPPEFCYYNELQEFI